MNLNYETLQIEQNEFALILTINRPEALNALSVKVHKELKSFLTELASNIPKGVSGLILTGAGDKAFIAGADIKAMQSMGQEEAKTFCQLGQDVSSLFESLPLPVIACVNGFALGGGCEMAMSCDLIYGTEKALFGQPEVNLGLIPGFGGTQRLSRYVGAAMAKELIYTGRNVKASEAKEIGLLQKVFSSQEEMMDGAMEVLKTISYKSPIIVAKAKEVINAGEFESIENGLAIEREAFSWTFTTGDMKEGVAAFVEKRRPVFKGS